jgi:hypothetical protein
MSCSSCCHIAAFGLALAAAAAPRAEVFGHVTLASDNIERGVSQSDRRPSLSALLGARHGASGLYAQLGAASVSDRQYLGSDGYQLRPELGWAREADKWRFGLALNAQLFPGARGPWLGSLPERLQPRALTLQTSDYSTVEARAMLGWKFATLSVSRSLTDYLGLSATETGPLGTRVIESKGSTYVTLDLAWPITERTTLSAAVGRLSVPNFEGLSSTDWRLGASTLAWGLSWALEASAGQDGASAWRPASRSGESSARVQASVGWSF